MIQTPDITSSYRCVFAQEGLSGPLSPHMTTSTYTYPSKATRGPKCQGRGRGGLLQLITGLLEAKLDKLGVSWGVGVGVTPLALRMSCLRFLSLGSQYE